MIIEEGIGVERVQPPARLTIELPERTAEILCALIGGIRGGGTNVSNPLQALFNLLDEALPSRTDGFEDLLDGPPPEWRPGIK